MNRIAKCLVVSLVLATGSVFAQEAEDVSDGAVGYTPVLLSMASPVSFPYGSHMWDVRGVALGLFYTDAPKVYGINLTPFGANLNRSEMYGLDVAGLFTWCQDVSYGVKLTLVANVANKESAGVEIGSVSMQRQFKGIDVELALAVGESMEGFQAAFVGTCNKEYAKGLTMAAGANLAKEMTGCQIAGVFNQTDYLKGCQIGLFNFAKECPKGLQIGLVNIIVDNQIKALPIVNGYFGE